MTIPRRTARLLRQTAVLFALWFLLSGQTDGFHLGIGLMSALAVAWLTGTTQPEPDNRLLRFPWGRFFLYLPWLFSRIVISNLHVAWLILHPRCPIAPRLLHYRTKLQHPAAKVLFANSITLTPGTITAELNGDQLVVHALDDGSAADVETGLLERRVAWVFDNTG